MSWLIFALSLLFVAAVDGYFTRRREAHKSAQAGHDPTTPPAAPPGAGAGDLLN